MNAISSLFSASLANKNKKLPLLKNVHASSLALGAISTIGIYLIFNANNLNKFDKLAGYSCVLGVIFAKEDLKKLTDKVSKISFFQKEKNKQKKTRQTLFVALGVIAVAGSLIILNNNKLKFHAQKLPQHPKVTHKLPALTINHLFITVLAFEIVNFLESVNEDKEKLDWVENIKMNGFSIFRNNFSFFPIQETHHFYSLYSFKKQAHKSDFAKYYKSFEKKISKIALKTIRNFLKSIEQKNKINLQLNEIIFVESERSETLVIDHRKIIFISSKVLKEASSGELCDSCKFEILHEVGHALNNDSFFKSNTAISFIAILTWVGSFYNFSYLGSCAIAKGSKKTLGILEDYLSRKRESRADEFACKKGGIEAAFGGFFYCFRDSEYNKYLRKQSWEHYFLYSPSGDHRICFSYPAITKRMEFCIEKSDLNAEACKQKAEDIISTYYDPTKDEWKFPNHSVYKG